MSNAVVLVSGGLDSTTTLALARREHSVHAISFRYGQRHAAEIDAAKRAVARFGAVRHIIVDIDLRVFGGSALTAEIDVPKQRATEAMMADIPITYVPARNTIFLSYAVAFAEVAHARDIYIGVNAIDYSGYPDCRPEFIEAFARVANLGTRAGITGETIAIRAPLISMTKAEIIRTGLALGVDYSETVSCYDPTSDGRACRDCDACVLRAKGFSEAGITDPTRYA